jgi:hypothetical protein
MHFINIMWRTQGKCACNIHSAFLYCMLDRAVSHCLHACCFAGAERSESWNQRKQQQLRCTEPEKAMGIEGQSENSEDHEDISVHVEQSLH